MFFVFLLPLLIKKIPKVNKKKIKTQKKPKTSRNRKWRFSHRFSNSILLLSYRYVMFMGTWSKAKQRAELWWRDGYARTQDALRSKDQAGG